MSAAAAAALEKKSGPESADPLLREQKWQPVLEASCLLTVDLPIPGFHVADFLKLQVESVISTGWRLSRDVPLRVNGTLIAWGEFEASRKHLAVRITELA